jgi:murein peptide amidase A
MGRGMQRFAVGASVEGRELILRANFAPREAAALAHPRGTLLIGGTHGDERATVDLLEAFASERAAGLSAPVAVLGLHNPDGHAAGIRYNARGVDLNRNFPHRWSPASEEPPGEAPLSEPEARALHDLILALRPRKIVSLHWALSEIDADGPQSAALAEAMWDALSAEEKRPYRLRVHRPDAPAAGFCPGSLGQWAGHGLAYEDGTRPAMVTLELPYHSGYHPRPDPLPEDHLEGVRTLWSERPGEYLAAVGGPALRMLEAACGLPHPWPPPAP